MLRVEALIPRSTRAMQTPQRWVRDRSANSRPASCPAQPMLADKVPGGDGWIHELKHDGSRVLAFKDGEKVRLWSRNARDWSSEATASPSSMMRLNGSARIAAVIATKRAVHRQKAMRGRAAEVWPPTSFSLVLERTYARPRPCCVPISPVSGGCNDKR